MTPQEAVDLLVSQFGDCFDRHAKMFFRQDAMQYIQDVALKARADALEEAAQHIHAQGKIGGWREIAADEIRALKE